MCKELGELRLHVGGGFFGERDGEDVARLEAIVFDQRSIAFDQNRGFAGARTRDDAGIRRGDMRWPIADRL